jgi:hypothetical protein
VGEYGIFETVMYYNREYHNAYAKKAFARHMRDAAAIE